MAIAVGRHEVTYRTFVSGFTPLGRPGQRTPCQRANHHDPVTASHLAGGEPGSVTKARTIKEKRHDTGNEQIIRQAYDSATLLGRDGGDVSDAEAVLLAVPDRGRITTRGLIACQTRRSCSTATCTRSFPSGTPNADGRPSSEHMWKTSRSSTQKEKL